MIMSAGIDWTQRRLKQMQPGRVLAIGTRRSLATQLP
jgi:hypothetical protein